MKPTVLLTSLFVALASAAPVTSVFGLLLKRAGGPIGEPIPDKCHIETPMDCVDPDTTHKLSHGFASSAHVYAYYLPMDSRWQTHEEELQQCVEQCYGYGSKGDCVSIFMAYNVPLPAAYPGKTGQLSVGCQMFGERITHGDFVDARKSRFTHATAQNIVCPKN